MTFCLKVIEGSTHVDARCKLVISNLSLNSLLVQSDRNDIYALFSFLTGKIEMMIITMTVIQIIIIL